MAQQGGGDRLVPLDELGGKGLAEGERDVRGWEVMAADGTRVGEVDTVLVDADVGRIRYLDVGVAAHLTPGREERHVLVPMDGVRLAPEGETVVVERLRGEDISNLPPYKHEPITHEYQLELKDRIGDRIAPASEPEQGFLGKPTDQERDASG